MVVPEDAVLVLARPLDGVADLEVVHPHRLAHALGAALEVAVFHLHVERGDELGMATYIVALRKGHLTDMLPLNAIGAFIGFLLALAVCAMSGVGIALSLHDTLWSLALGVFQLGLALVLYTAGSRTLPAADISLVAMAEIVLAPLWVWLVFGETAGVLTLAGGALLMTAIAGDAISGIRARRLKEASR